ncbi:hypothetical protein E2320_010087 [Naja naja]|nr:hypothetical protein E2320_010087 [Naja naja]
MRWLPGFLTSTWVGEGKGSLFSIYMFNSPCLSGVNGSSHCKIEPKKKTKFGAEVLSVRIHLTSLQNRGKGLEENARK